MRCILCFQTIGTNSFKEMFFHDDVLCENCRKKLVHDVQTNSFQGYPYTSSYVYNKAFSECLIQYKELCDEALYEMFLYPYRKRFQKKFKGYTICLLPSSKENLKRRGFSHLKRICECLDMEVLEPFEKLVDTSQKKQNRYQRLKIDTFIRLKPGVRLPKKILLFDDVLTTGATMLATLHCLNESKHEIQIYTLARTIDSLNKSDLEEN